MTPLHRAIAFAQMHDVSVRVAHELDLHVPGAAEVFLEIDFVGAERGEGFLLPRAKDARTAFLTSNRSPRGAPAARP